MGSGNPTFDKAVWNNAMTHSGQVELHNDVCNEITHPQLALPSSETDFSMTKMNNGVQPFAQVHCIEPMPTTAWGKNICLLPIQFIHLYISCGTCAW